MRLFALLEIRPFVPHESSGGGGWRGGEDLSWDSVMQALEDLMSGLGARCRPPGFYGFLLEEVVKKRA